MSKDKSGQGDKNNQGPAAGRDWGKTLFLPKTDFPMRAGLPKKEPELLARWDKIGLYDKLRENAKGRRRFVLHDGPPYANGNIHIGHALNKILKDIVVKSQQMLGHDSPYVPGWDCHGLPIEWKIEEQYRSKGKQKPDFTDAAALNAFRGECRQFAAKWLDVQREEFKRLGVVGDWANPYSTMAFKAEAAIARELMKFAKNGLLYRGSKPVMWSGVEKTALAEAEVEYQDHQSDMIWVKFPLTSAAGLDGCSVVIWTTTPWTIPGNRAISFSSKIDYGIYEVTAAPEGNWAKVGGRFVLADKLVAEVMKAAKVESFEKRATVTSDMLKGSVCAHPLASLGYDFDIPLLDGDHVTDDTGTGFVHTAPGHGADDYIIWTANQKKLREQGIDTTVPFTVDSDGFFTDEAPGFDGKRVLKENGDKGDANEAVIKALAEAGNIIARGRLKHQYPHSWRSKKPVIFRNTPQWFISVDNPVGDSNESLREIALAEIERTAWVPKAGEKRITGMVDTRPDWVVSRQRAWGVPITVFRHAETGQIAPGPDFANSAELAKRIEDAFEERGADCWFEEDATRTFLEGLVATGELDKWEKVTDVLDVWFDSGSTHSFTLDNPDVFPAYKGLARKVDGGQDTVMYLEGSDQHRGWFQSSLLESSGTRGRAPFDIVLTHGFVLDEKGQKMSKSLGNVVSPQDVIEKSGADILRLWVAASDYSDDLRIGPEILKMFSETYRKLRNTIRWMLGALAHFKPEDAVSLNGMPELERLMLYRLAELDIDIRKAYEGYDYRRVVGALSQFMNTELSAFYFDIRKDALYCEPPSSLKRKAALTVVDQLAATLIRWLAPILAFTADEAWQLLRPNDDSIHLTSFPELPRDWRTNEQKNLAAKWERVRDVRSVVTGALELERAAKNIGSSLEAAPVVHVTDKDLMEGLEGVDMAEVCITSAIEITDKLIPDGAFMLAEVSGVGVILKRAKGKKCARSWRVTEDVGRDLDYPDLSARDAAAVCEIEAAGVEA